MLNTGDKVRVVNNGSEDFGKLGVVIAYAGITVGEVETLVEGRDMAHPGEEGRFYKVKLDGERGIKYFPESDLELISKS